jgi:predicted nucleic acid-binding protein
VSSSGTGSCGSLARRQTVTRTAHVLTETLNLRKHSKLKQREEQFRGIAIDVMLRSGIREIQCDVGEMCGAPNAISREQICRFGITDAAILYAARRENCVIVTVDHKLFQLIQPDDRNRIQMLDHLVEDPALT